VTAGVLHRGAHRSRRLALVVALGLVTVSAGAVLLPTATVGAASAPGPSARLDTGRDPGNLPTSPTDSLDWAGYVASGRTFTSISGDWTQPSVACAGTKAAQSAFWVGLDGFTTTDQTVEQIGTDSDCTKASKNWASQPLS